jgi:hypothetical protein
VNHLDYSLTNLTLADRVKFVGHVHIRLLDGLSASMGSQHVGLLEQLVQVVFGGDLDGLDRVRFDTNVVLQRRHYLASDAFDSGLRDEAFLRLLKTAHLHQPFEVESDRSQTDHAAALGPVDLDSVSGHFLYVRA